MVAQEVVDFFSLPDDDDSMHSSRAHGHKRLAMDDEVDIAIAEPGTQ